MTVAVFVAALPALPGWLMAIFLFPLILVAGFTILPDKASKLGRFARMLLAAFLLAVALSMNGAAVVIVDYCAPYTMSDWQYWALGCLFLP